MLPIEGGERFLGSLAESARIARATFGRKARHRPRRGAPLVRVAASRTRTRRRRRRSDQS